MARELASVRRRFHVVWTREREKERGSEGEREGRERDVTGSRASWVTRRAEVSHVGLLIATKLVQVSALCHGDAIFLSLAAACSAVQNINKSVWNNRRSARTSRKFIKVGLFAVAQRLRVSEARCCTAGAETHVSKVSMMERSGRDQKEARVLRSWLKRANMDGRIDLTGP